MGGAWQRQPPGVGPGGELPPANPQEQEGAPEALFTAIIKSGNEANGGRGEFKEQTMAKLVRIGILIGTAVSWLHHTGSLWLALSMTALVYLYGLLDFCDGVDLGEGVRR